MATRRENVQDIIGERFKPTNVNASLWFDKFIYDSRKATPNRPETKRFGKSEASFYDTDKKDETAKSALVEQLTKIISEPPIYKVYYEAWEKKISEFAKCRHAKVKNRLAINLGSESVLETSIALHRLFGVPFIPGSALKGLVSHFLHQYGGKDWEKKSDNHTIVFGNQENAGFVTFYDALYVPESGFNQKPLYADVMTTHHSEYYGGGNAPPADWDSPNPVPFISATGEFLIALSGPPDWVELTFKILGYALETEGIGAKTSSGYGRMSYSGGFILAEAEIEAQQAEQFEELFAEMEKLVNGDPATKKAAKRKLKEFTRNLQSGNPEHEEMADALDDKAIELGIKDELLKTKPDWFEPIWIIVGE